MKAFAHNPDKEALFDQQQVRGQEVGMRSSGELDSLKALEQLIGAHGLCIRQVNDRTFVVGSASFHLGSGSDTAAVDTTAGIVEEVMVFSARSTDMLSIGSKSGQSLRETPKSVTLVTREGASRRRI